MTHFFYLVAFLGLAINELAFGEILTFGKSAVPTTSQPNEHKEEQSHLPLSSLFSQSNKYKCMIEGKKELCTNDDVKYLKDKFGDEGVQDNKDSKAATPTTQINDQAYKNTVYGPRYQPIHLALPHKAMHEIGHVETVKLNNRDMEIKTISRLPYIFEVTNFLSRNETDLIIDMAKEKGLKERPSKPHNVELWEEMDHRLFDSWDIDVDGKISIDELTQLKKFYPYLLTMEDMEKLISIIDHDEDGYLSYGEIAKDGLQKIKKSLEEREKRRSERKSKGGFETWLWHDEDELLAYEDLLEDFHQRIEKITDIPEDLIERSEPLSVQRYEQDAFSPCQQDSEPTNSDKECCTYGTTNCRMCRYISIHIFLTDDHKGGDLVFPIADNETFNWQNLKHDLLRKCEKTPNATSSNLVIKPQRGKAVFWYNHEILPNTGWMGQLEARAISSTTPVIDKSAWSAKMWLNIIGDGVNVLKPWRMASNWLKLPNKNEKIIEKLRNDFYREGEQYLHIYRNSYKQVSPSQRKYDDNDFLKPPTNIKYTENEDTKDEIKIETSIKSDPSQASDKQQNEKQNENFIKEKIIEPIGPDMGVQQTPVLGFHHKKRSEVPLGPPKRPMDPQYFNGKKVIENALLKASLLLVEELDREELEILARTLHDKLQLQCIPLIINPIR